MTEEDVINSLLAKNFLLKLIQAVILSIYTHKQNIISVGNENKKNPFKEKWNHCNYMPMLSLLGKNHRLPLSHMDKRLIWINETKKRIDEFKIGYMINPNFNIKKSFR